jgi:hypothetical protein
MLVTKGENPMETHLIEPLRHHTQTVITTTQLDGKCEDSIYEDSIYEDSRILT